MISDDRLEENNNKPGDYFSEWQIEIMELPQAWK